MPCPKRRRSSMPKSVFVRSKPIVTVGTIGHIDHGKTTLTSVITGLLARRGLARATSYDEVAKASIKDGRRVEGRDDHDLARPVRDRGPALHAHRLPGSRGLHQEHDHGRGADGRGDPA